MGLSLLLLLCNYDNLTLEFHKKNSYLNEVWLFLGRFKTGSLPRMINKEVLAQFIYKPIYSIEKLFNIKKWKFIILTIYIEERGWVKAKIRLTNC